MRWLLVALATISLTVGSAPASSEPPDPCLLVTPSDATPVFGSAPAHTRTTGSATRRCVYAAGHASMTVSTRALRSESAFVAATRSVRGPVLPIATLSNAYSGESGRELLLWKGGVEVTISFTGLDPVFATQATLAAEAVRSL